MKRRQRLWKQSLRTISMPIAFALIFLLGFAFGTQQGALLAQDRPSLTPEQEVLFEPLFQTYDLLQTQYVEPVDPETLVDGAISGMVDSLDDPYTNYVGPDLFAFVDSDLSGEIEGIGVVISPAEDENEIMIVNVLEDTPAQRSGLEEGDIFVAVNGEEVYGFDNLELAARVRGPAGTTVNLTMRRGDELIDFVVERARIVIPNVETDILEGDIAYIRLSQFSSPARSQIDDALAELNVNSRSGLIFDLRGNPGGFLSTAVEIGALFVEDGTLLTEEFSGNRVDSFEVRDGIVYRVTDRGESVYTRNAAYANITVPIVVLVDERSASASELVTGAWQDYGVVTVVGETTFGKGTVQTQTELVNGGGVRVTIARWLTPAGSSISGEGVTPDVVVSAENDGGANGRDAQLDAAIKVLEALNEPEATP